MLYHVIVKENWSDKILFDKSSTMKTIIKQAEQVHRNSPKASSIIIKEIFTPIRNTI